MARTLVRTKIGRYCAFGAATFVLSLQANAQTTSPVLGIGGIPPSPDFDVSHVKGFRLDYGADVGFGESDNVTLAPTDKLSQTMAVADVDFDMHERSLRLDADAKGDFSYLDFLQGAYGSELIGRFNGVADVALLPERITWQVQDSFGQAQLDPFAAATPANRENVNYVSTGPDVNFRFGPQFFLTGSARYARVSYQTSPFDTNRLQGNIGLGMQLSARSNVSLDGAFERVLFDNTEVNGIVVNTDFNRSQLFGHYELVGSRTELNASLGATKYVQGPISKTDPTAQLRMQRRMSSASRITLNVGRDVTDASSGFNNMQSGAIGAVGVAPAAQALINYTATYGSAVWEYVRNRTTVALSGSWERDSYSGLSSLNSTREDGQVRLERRLTRALTAQIIGGVDRVVYPHPVASPLVNEGVIGSSGEGFTQTLSEVGGSLAYQWPRGLELRLRYQHTSRIAGGFESGTGYDENRVFLTVGYHPARIIRE
jgi:hypothetical protein